MIEKEALNFILQDLPEAIISTMFCFVFLNLRFKWKQIFVIAVLLSLTDMIELLPVVNGIRTIILMIAFVVYIKIITRENMSRIFIAVFAVFLLSAVGDSVLGASLQYVTGLSFTHVYNIPYLRALFSYPTLFMILVITYFLYRYKKNKKVNFR